MVQEEVLTMLIVVYLLVQIPRTDAEVSAIIVFGDSSVDSGNNNHLSTVLKSNFPPYGRDVNGGQPTGRFSNGRIPPDFISEAFGIKKMVPAYLDPTLNITDFVNGVCFASAGTGYDSATSDVLSVIPLWKELDYYKEYQGRLRMYLGNEEADEVLEEALYLISVGTNDFLENYYLLPRRSSQFSVVEYQNFLAGIAKNFVRELYKLGARKISLAGIPPMGCLPLERTRRVFYGGQCVEAYNKVAREFNTKLDEMVLELNKELDEIQLVFSNPYDIFTEIIQKPESFGFQNVKSACCGTGYFEISYTCDRMNPFTCTDASKYAFWDSIHPTEKTNSILASYVVKNDLGQFQQ